MKNLMLSFVLSIILIPFSAMGYGYLDASGLGSIMPGVDAVSHSLGGVSSVDVGGMNLFGNPAELTVAVPSISASLGALVLKQSVDDPYGKHSLTYAGPGASSFQASYNTGSTGFAIGIAKIRDYTYKGEYFFIEADPDPIIAGFENFIVDGGVWEAAVGAAAVIPSGISVGASAGYRLGDINYEYYWHQFEGTVPDSSSEWSRQEGEFSWRAGVSIPAGEGTEVGAAYSSKSLNCAASISAGVRFGDMAAYSPGFGLEARVYDNPENPAWAANVFGGIHAENKLYFRGGLVLFSRGGDSSGASLGVSMGACVDLGRTDINAAFNYSNEARSDNVIGFPEAQSINDIVTAFTIGASIAL
jgi:hypothetical protein